MAIIKIKGMSCQHCVGSVKEALEKIVGVSNVEVDLNKGEAKYDGNVGGEAVRSAIQSIGFEVVE